MTTLVRPRAETRAGLFLAWSFTLAAILAIGVVALTAPVPPLADAAGIGLGAPDPAPATGTDAALPRTDGADV